MDGKNFKLIGDLKDYFTIDSYGSYIPNPELLKMGIAQEMLDKQLKTNTGFYDRLAQIYERTDVVFTDNPLGNSPCIGAGFKLYGKRPYLPKKEERTSALRRGQDPSIACEKRERKIENIELELLKVHEGLKPTIETPQQQLNYDVEYDQALTGGGFDNNHIGGVHKSALNFVIDASSDIGYADSPKSKTLIEAALWLRDLLKSYGFIEGSLEPMGATQVRALQENDGMFGFPVYAAGNTPLDQDLAKRLLILTGVDTSQFVGTDVTDRTNGNGYKYRVIDAAAHILDNKVFTYDDLVSIVTLLARIQKHGFKMENGKLTPKDGKTRSVYPNAFIPAVIEAMIMDPFCKKMKEVHAPIMPSLQDKPTRVEMIKKQIQSAFEMKYDYLAADWSKYDATVKGAILATIIQYAVKPFFNAKYYFWVDAATYILTYKYLLLDTDLAAINTEMYDQAKAVSKFAEVKNYTLFGMIDGLISGAKFTHVGGSLYGECVIHYCVPVLMGYKPIPGAQAGDDTLMGIPQDRIDVSSVNNTYDPIEAAAKEYGLKMNVSKQIWVQQLGEIVKVFLQDNYHYNTDTWGIGSIFRPAAAIFLSEHDKGLTVAEQLMAEIARANQGADSPFVKPVVEWWFTKEKYLGYLFNRYGVNAFHELVKQIGKPIAEIANTIDVGSFTFGVDKEDMESGNLPILPICAEVAQGMTFSSEDVPKFMRDLTVAEGTEVETLNPEFDDDDSIE